jgi:hypothetical protein
MLVLGGPGEREIVKIDLACGLAFGLSCGLVLGLVVGLVFRLGLTNGIPVGLVFGLSAGLTYVSEGERSGELLPVVDWCGVSAWCSRRGAR